MFSTPGCTHFCIAHPIHLRLSNTERGYTTLAGGLPFDVQSATGCRRKSSNKVRAGTHVAAVVINLDYTTAR